MGRLFLLALLTLGLGAAAQQPDLPKIDTTVADTIVVGADASQGAGTGNIDTSAVVDTGQQAVDSVFLRAVPDSVAEAWRKDRRFAYANDPDYWRRQHENNNGWVYLLLRLFMSPWFRYFIYILVGGVLLFAIVRIMSENNLGLFYRRRTGKMAGTRPGDEDTEADEDLDARLQQALDNKDYRQAIRYLYRRSLRTLGERQLIRLNAQSTNHEYLVQLAGTPQEAPFRFLTLAYEKVWYGEFTLSDELFQRLYRHFMDFDKTVRP